jgi:hypothetical protein
MALRKRLLFALGLLVIQGKELEVVALEIQE